MRCGVYIVVIKSQISHVCFKKLWFFSRKLTIGIKHVKTDDFWGVIPPPSEHQLPLRMVVIDATIKSKKQQKMQVWYFSEALRHYCPTMLKGSIYQKVLFELWSKNHILNDSFLVYVTIYFLFAWLFSNIIALSFLCTKCKEATSHPFLDLSER